MPRKLKIVEEPPEIEYLWRRGFVAPRIDVAQVAAAINELPEPEPEQLFEASKAEDHVLHEAVWSEGDQEWARRGRIEFCRRILSNIVEIVQVGGQTIETRAYEYVRGEGAGRWSSISSIMADPELRDAYLAEIQRLQMEAAAKLERFRELMKGV
jgi:hypothetical protein